ncbi:Uma2 family endonuclease [Geminocystis sp. GBBB08]|uniref:Uma2 family endonuclease n=1 Tax=Geminocystis sp. GBBB08 TaxID=2604140 RepID=UPI0027E38FAF|nr:Uma2 family endonuclease [Geminocystis sp. GBBB08]MBL1210650.1 Uma2 family endonuclease [Geminocystis sp. GBBB08]
MNTLVINCNSVALTNKQFFQLCINNPNVRLEKNHRGDLVIMTPVGDISSNRNAGIIAQLWLWNSNSNLGMVFDSSAGFILPNNAIRSPDASWISIEKWQLIPHEEKEKFSHICPDFVIELMSPSDNLKDTQKKMKEYIENGAKLGWLINRKNSQVEIYRENKEVEILNNPNSLSGENILVNFVLNMEQVW